MVSGMGAARVYIECFFCPLWHVYKKSKCYEMTYQFFPFLQRVNQRFPVVKGKQFGGGHFGLTEVGNEGIDTAKLDSWGGDTGKYPEIGWISCVIYYRRLRICKCVTTIWHEAGCGWWWQYPGGVCQLGSHHWVYYRSIQSGPCNIYPTVKSMQFILRSGVHGYHLLEADLPAGGCRDLKRMSIWSAHLSEVYIP